jgi:hypothetical protein
MKSVLIYSICKGEKNRMKLNKVETIAHTTVKHDIIKRIIEMWQRFMNKIKNYTKKF